MREPSKCKINVEEKRIPNNSHQNVKREVEGKCITNESLRCEEIFRKETSHKISHHVFENAYANRYVPMIKITPNP